MKPVRLGEQGPSLADSQIIEVRRRPTSVSVDLRLWDETRIRLNVGDVVAVWECAALDVDALYFGVAAGSFADHVAGVLGGARRFAYRFLDADERVVLELLVEGEGSIRLEPIPHVPT